MVTVYNQTFSDGQTLTQWLVEGGAPALPPGASYRLIISREGGVQNVTAQIVSHTPDSILHIHGAYTAHTRVSVAMAAVSAATYAFEGASFD